ncbi:MAG TPA: hypothetical protein VMC84_09300 [Methanocella sp.]|uniref:hypothetical protein n=1 Tax=Methanocella sp. TaxID=2052833 RepID=UPI002D1B6D77|nr:hypothetical protein [Methanocella sp.]HTY91359.1 hypothetical protein [Methanocella sp.]
MTKKSMTCVLVLIVLAAIVSLAGCTAPSTDHKATLAGKDVFDPAKFSMATYTIATAENQSQGLLTVLAYPGEKDGDRLASVTVSGNVSSRLDAWLNRSHEGVNNATLTVIDGEGMQTVAMPKSLNMTTMDETWNTPGSTYDYYGTDSVIVPAGQYNNCTVYYGTKTIQYMGSNLSFEVIYYMHPSSPVPIFYMVKSSDGIVAYALNSVYGPDDIDSTPERTAQSYFDRISSGEYTRAARLLVTVDGSTLKPMGRDSILSMEENMSRTYGTAGEKMAIQYILTDSIQSTGRIGGHNAVAVHWSSIHYSRSPGQVYYIDGTFNMVDDGGWKIIV